MARAGVASRRSSEEIIAAGRVEVNGRRASLGERVDPAEDEILVDGQAITGEKLCYYLLNKPPGYITTLSDPRGRPTVMDLLPETESRIYPVGRLDRETRGLLLLTNDGQLTHRLTHPSFESKKTYRIRLRGSVSEDDLFMLQRGIPLEEGLTAPAEVSLLAGQSKAGESLLEITIHEGRNRQLRRMAAYLGYEVLDLCRIGLHFLTLEGLGEGEWRKLTTDEVKRLRFSLGLK